MRRRGKLAIATLCVALVAAACSSGGSDSKGTADRSTTTTGPTGASGAGDGFADPAWFRSRQDGYLAYATEELDPGSITNVLAHAERTARDPSFTWDAASVTPQTLAAPLADIKEWKDTSDFDVLYFVNLLLGYRDQLPAATATAIEKALFGFEYWFTEPTPPGIVDEKYYWSENHRIIFHTIEYLMGQAHPDTVFTNDGRTGAAHRDEAKGRIIEWLKEKAELGFSEWHSDVYYQKDVDPLVALVEYADDPEIATRAAMVLDLFLFDIALHLNHGNMGVTHGRSYAKDKTKATDENTFNLAKLLFDDTDLPYTSRGDAGATFLAGARKYRLPDVLRRVAASEAPMVDEERMGVPLDATAPITADPKAPYGYDFDDPKNLEFWWERGAQAAWQLIPLTAETVTKYDLWETPTFSPFKDVRDAVGGDAKVAQQVVQPLAATLSFALLSEANTVTYRTRDAMLSTVQDFRPSTYGDQVQSWQATLDETAIVFTTNPKNEPYPKADSWPDDDGYWTGTGTLPRSAQHGATSINLYAPGTPEKGIAGFDRLDYTHAWFPTERFDQVVRAGHWTFGRKGDGYVGLWSWRAPEWRTYQPGEVFTDGMTEPYDLVAKGGADDVWIAQVGDATSSGTFAEFQASLTGAAVDVAPRPSKADGLPGGFDVTFASPTEGVMTLGQDGPFTVAGKASPLRFTERYDNPWAHVPFRSQRYVLADDQGGVTLDFAKGTRTGRSG